MSDNIRAQELLAQEGLESIAQKLYNKIYIELPGEPNAPRRWIWELLQNAKDVISKNGKVIINLRENSIEFSHNGAPFLHENLLALLSQNSTKKHNYSDDEKLNFFKNLYNTNSITKETADNFLNISGRFGTGFMTTYLLSKKVQLKGIYSKNSHHKNFEISFDRDVERDIELKKKVKESFSSFTELEQSNGSNIISDYKSGESCDTKFIYNFGNDGNGKDIAVQGISDLHNAIPFVLSFVDKLKTIEINEHGKLTTYTHNTEIEEDIFSVEKIKKQTDNNEAEVFYVAKLSEKFSSLSIATPIKKLDSGKFKIVYPHKQTPKQFISFPLVGSETFPFPVIINSPLFNPNDSRSHVYLNLTASAGFNKKVELNRLLFEKSILLFKALLKIASEKGWEDINLLAKSDLPTSLNDDWYKDSIQHEIRKEILDAEIVVTEDGKKIKPKDSLFPMHDETSLEEFWELCKYLNKNKLPRKEDAEIWKTIIGASIDNWLGNSFDLTLKKLLKQIESEITFKDFALKFFEGNEENAFKALNKIIQFVEKEDNKLINDKENSISIFPDQTLDSNFKTKKSLSRDLGIPIQIKDVLKELGEDWYKDLVRNEITVFERDAKLSVKNASNKIREIIEQWFVKKPEEAKIQNIQNGLLKLSKYCTETTKEEVGTIYKYLKEYFPSQVHESIIVINDVEDFDWNPIKKWSVLQVFEKVSSFTNFQNFSKHLFDKEYPTIKEEYSEEDKELKYKSDTKINDLIQFGLKFDKSLLEKHSIIPNQLNQFCLYNKEIYNDNDIPKELKKIITDFGYDCRGNLLHEGVSIDLPNDKRDLKWICSELDDIVIKEQENPELKQPIRELDKWISKKKGAISRLDELFKSFYRKRSGIVLNTYDIKERDQFDAILKSGMSNDFAEIVKTGTSIESVKKVTAILKENPNITSENIGEIAKVAKVLNKFPSLTSDKIEQLLELEELSKGWNPELTYTPDEEQTRKNFETGWKGEAFVFKELMKLGLVVEWTNLSQEANGNKIVDYENETHYIVDKGDKYDLVVKNESGKDIYIQVKSTTTSLTQADQIALPISTREWNFVFETIEDDYYLARVFDINSEPSVYYMKLELPNELMK